MLCSQRVMVDANPFGRAQSKRRLRFSPRAVFGISDYGSSRKWLLDPQKCFLHCPCQPQNERIGVKQAPESISASCLPNPTQIEEASGHST